jgi:hypothetical protein
MTLCHNVRCSRQAIFGWRRLAPPLLFDSLAAELGRYRVRSLANDLVM